MTYLRRPRGTRSAMEDAFLGSVFAFRPPFIALPLPLTLLVLLALSLPLPLTLSCRRF